ncbi:MAG: hypothetical protein ACRDRS_13885 [Pseudonocardiaceae bacterium]
MWGELAELERAGYHTGAIDALRSVLLDHQPTTRAGRCHGCRRLRWRCHITRRHHLIPVPSFRHFPCLVWTSRLGHTDHHWPPVIIEQPPDPIPRNQPPYPRRISPEDGWEDSQIWAERQVVSGQIRRPIRIAVQLQNTHEQHTTTRHRQNRAPRASPSRTVNNT